jgi:hypothetical protein
MASNAYTVHPRPEDIAIDEARRAMLRRTYNELGMWWLTRKRPIRRVKFVTLAGRRRTVAREKDGSYKVQVSDSTYIVKDSFQAVYRFLQMAKDSDRRIEEHFSRFVPRRRPLGIIIHPAFVHPDIAAHALTAYWQQVRYWDGMNEAANRSQSAPGWLRWETITIKPKAEAVTLTVIEGGVKALAADLGNKERLGRVAQKSPEELAAWMRRWRVAHGYTEEMAS